MPKGEDLRAIIIGNAAELNRLASRVHETFKRRDESEELRQEWSDACEEFHDRYGELWIPGGSDPHFYERVVAGDPAAVEAALCFLEARPYFFRSGYHWKKILQKCRRAPMSAEQAERFASLLEKYSEWRRLRNLSSKRGRAVRVDLYPLIRCLNGLFPVFYSPRLPAFKFDGLVTLGDLYRILCEALRLEPDTQPAGPKGVVRDPREPMPRPDMSAWARERPVWREFPWTPEDVWATLVSKIVEVYQLDSSSEVTPEMVLTGRTTSGNSPS
ncbi:MAG TPA: hypothetical protein VN893_18855 [Bryobacteraceae bacterium]|nr:hypothetical protein [Bryobacteraceae bacterium]